MNVSQPRFFPMFLLLGLVIAATLAFYAAENGTSIPVFWGGSKYLEVENRQPVETTPLCTWVDVKGPNGVRALKCMILPIR